jgi:hypothetical protein
MTKYRIKVTSSRFKILIWGIVLGVGLTRRIDRGTGLIPRDSLHLRTAAGVAVALRKRRRRADHSGEHHQEKRFSHGRFFLSGCPSPGGNSHAPGMFRMISRFRERHRSLSA